MDRMLVAGGTPAVYSYLFAHPPHGDPTFGKFGTPVFASHTAELGYGKTHTLTTVHCSDL